MYDLIEKYPVKFPDPIKHGIDMSDEVKEMIQSLLEKNPKKRLGAKSGIKEILSHDWFKKIDVDKILSKEYDAPYIPPLTDDIEDVSNFDNEFTSESLTQSIIPQSGMKNVYKYNAKFSDFDK